MTHAERLNAHMRADTAGNKETRDDRALPPSFCRWGCQKRKKKKNSSTTSSAITSDAPRKLQAERMDERRRAREPGASTNAVDPIAIATVGAATWTYQQPVATMRDINNNMIFFKLYFIL